MQENTAGPERESPPPPGLSQHSGHTEIKGTANKVKVMDTPGQGYLKGYIKCLNSVFIISVWTTVTKMNLS